MSNQLAFGVPMYTTSTIQYEPFRPSIVQSGPFRPSTLPSKP